MENIMDYGQVMLDNGKENKRVQLISIIGEIEGHELLASTSKTTKYEHLIPIIAKVEDDKKIDGILIVINTVGGDVECGLALAELIASMSKPSVALILGGSHSIGVPLATAADYSFIVPSATMVVHPVRMSGLFIGVPQTYDYFKRIQDRITEFVEMHSDITRGRYIELINETGVFTKDVGTILVGEEAVKEGLVDAIGGLKQAKEKLFELIDTRKINNNK